MHVRAFSFLSLCARNSLTFAALRPGDGLGPRCQYYRSPSDLCMSQSDVAAMMGLHQTTVARLIRRLREEGIIGRFTKRELQVLDRERLRRLAQHGDLKA